MAVADDGQFVVRKMGDFFTIQLIRAFRRPVETTQNVHERRLPGARWTHEGGKFSFTDDEIDTCQGGKILAANMIYFFNVCQFNQFLIHSVTPDFLPLWQYYMGGGPWRLLLLELLLEVVLAAV